MRGLAVRLAMMTLVTLASGCPQVASPCTTLSLVYVPAIIAVNQGTGPPMLTYSPNGCPQPEGSPSYSSDNPAVAAVDASSGIVTGGLEDGTATITVTHGSLDGSAEITVPACLGLAATLVGTAANDDLMGTAGNDVIVGLEGNDSINGLGGIDILCGREGDDVLIGGDDTDGLFGEDGNDSLIAGSGNDVLNGGPGDNGLDGGLGDDLADYAAATDHGITANLETGTADNGSGGMDTLSRIEHLMGTPFTDIMVGNLETNRLRDAGGDDFIFGGGGGDVIQGDAGNDQLGGGDGDDTIAGNEGDDFLFGDAGNDFLTGGDGFDTLDGGAGIDSCIGEMEMNC